MNASVTMKRSALCFCLFTIFLSLAVPGSARAQTGSGPTLPDISVLSDVGVFGTIGILNQGTSAINGSAASRDAVGTRDEAITRTIGSVFDRRRWTQPSGRVTLTPSAVSIGHVNSARTSFES